MIKRNITQELIESSQEYPIVTVLGPRQSGKTTLVQQTFPHKPYYLLETPDIRQAAATDPKGFLAQLPDGAILDENLLILECRKALLNQGRRPDIYFYRDSNGNEVDLLIRTSSGLLPVEIKSSATFNNSFLKGIENFRKVSSDCLQHAYLLYNGNDVLTINDIRVCNPLLDSACPDYNEL